MSVDLKYDVPCLRVFVYGIPARIGWSSGWKFVLVGEQHVPTLSTTILSDEFIARNDGFWRAPEHWFPLWNKGQKSYGRLQIWWSIQVSLHRESPEVGLVKKLTGNLHWWVEQCLQTLHRECYRTLWYTGQTQLQYPARLRAWIKVQHKGWAFDFPLSAIWSNKCSVRIPINAWCYISTSQNLMKNGI